MIKGVKFGWILIFILIPVLSLAQADINPNEYQEEVPVLLKNEYTAGINIHSNGWGLLFRRAKNKTVSKKRFWEIEFVSMKHPKEVRSVNPYVENAKSYIFGKMNTFLILRGGYGRQRILFDKAEKGGVAIRLNYGGGISLGFTKPIYLNIVHYTSGNPGGGYYTEIEKSNPDDPNQVPDNIYGRASFIYGITEMKIWPGLYAKAGMSFEYGRNQESIKALEIGMAIDAYARKIPIMGKIDNKQLFFIFYIHVMLGKRWI